MKFEYVIMNTTYHQIKKSYVTGACLFRGNTVYQDGQWWEVVSYNGYKEV